MKNATWITPAEEQELRVSGPVPVPPVAVAGAKPISFPFKQVFEDAESARYSMYEFRNEVVDFTRTQDLDNIYGLSFAPIVNIQRQGFTVAFRFNVGSTYFIEV